MIEILNPVLSYRVKVAVHVLAVALLGHCQANDARVWVC